MPFRPAFATVFAAALAAAVTAQGTTVTTAEEMQAAAYSRATNKVVLLPARTGTANLVLYSPSTGFETVALTGGPGEQLVVNANGTYAAVKHLNTISVVNLVNRTVVRAFQACCDNTGRIAIGDDWVYLPGTASYQISTGNVVAHTTPGAVNAELLPNNSAIYACSSSYNLVRIDTSTGPMTGSRTIAPSCSGGVMSISGGGTKLYTADGQVRTIPSDPAADPQYRSQIAEPTYLIRIHDLGDGKGVMVRNGAVSVFDTSTLRVLNTYYTAGYPLGSFLEAGGNGLYLVTSDRVTRMDLQTASTSCFASFYDPSFFPATREVPGTGQTISYTIDGSTPDCQFQLTTDVNWVDFVESVDGKTGGLQGSVRAVVRPNLTGVARTATMRVGSQSLTLTQGALQKSQMQRISVNVEDAEFNRANNTLVTISRSPDELHIYDPAVGATKFVRLSVTPLSVSVQPDGRMAAVGHAGWITLVSLESRSVTQQIKIPYPAQDIVLPGNGYVYVFAAERQNWGYYNLNTSTWTTVDSPLQSSFARYNSALKAIYVNSEKWSIANGVPAKVTIPAATACRNTEVSELGDLRIGCSNIVEASNDPAREGLPVATYPDSYAFQWDHSAAQHAFAGIADFNARIYVLGEKTGALNAQIDVPPFDGSGYSESRFAFWNREGSRIYTVTGPFIPGLLNTSPIEIGEFALPGVCPLQLSQSQVSAPATGTTGQIALTTSPGCIFSPVSVPSWVRITNITETGLQYEVLANDTPDRRSQGVTIGPKSILFTQAPGTGVVTLSPPSLTFGQDVTSLSLTIQTSSPTFSWTLTNMTPDVVLMDNISGVGTQTVNIVLGVNRSNAARSALLMVNGVPLTITQAGLNGSLTGATVITTLNANGDATPVTVASSTGAAPDNSQGVDSSWLRVAVVSATQVSVSALPNFAAGYRTGYFVANGARYRVIQSPAAALHYYPIAPCRLADTRLANGPYGGPFLAAGSTRTFQVYGGPCGIDSSATAFALNITVVPRGQLGYLTAYPAGKDRPTISLLNALDGRIKAAFTVVNAGTPGGGVSLFANNDTDVIVDVAGYFAPQTGTGLLFYPIAPCRVTDTRTTNNTLRAGVAQSIEVANKCGIPVTARVFSLSATAIPKTTLGYLQVWPTGQAQPNVSTLNATTGAITANALFAPAGTDGKVDVFGNNDADLLLDVNGFFDYPGSPGRLPYAYYRVDPCRMSDTRDTGVALSPANAFREIGGAGVCGLPYTTTYSLMNVTAIPIGPLGYLTVWGTGDRPVVSTLNALDGQITSNAAIIEQQPFPGNFRVFGSGWTHVFFDLTGYFGRFQ